MKIENLKEGMIIKNYKDLCILLGIEISAGNTKVSQLKEIERYCNYNKKGQSYIIEEVYLKPLDRNDGRVEGNKQCKNKKKDFANFIPSKEYYDKIGVYCIYDSDNNMYIGSTMIGFRNRFMQHKGKDNKSTSKKVIENNGVFDILWVSDVIDESIVRKIEDLYIEYYKDKTEWNIVNDRGAWSYTEKINPPKKKVIKINEDKYIEALNLLIEHGLLEIEEICE